MDKKIITKITIDGIENTGLISDGYHTFDELYEHRNNLFITLCKKMLENAELRVDIAIAKMKDKNFEGGIEDINPVWRSKLHSDGTMFDGWFILGLWGKDAKQITYHLPLTTGHGINLCSLWEQCNFAETLNKAPEFNGHTSEDVLKRIKKL